MAAPTKLLRLALVVGVCIAKPICESWCSHSCLELNGNPEGECSGCEAPNLCRPGEPGFDKGNANGETVLPQRESSPADEHHGGGGMYGTHGNPIKPPEGYQEDWVTGQCDLERVEHAQVTRQMLMDAEKPFIITGMTDGWNAHTTWALDELLKRYGDEPFQLHAHGNATLGDLLAWNGKYHMGHAVYPAGSCYSDPWRPYSPMLLGAFKEDYDLPRYLGPMTTFQMGVGTGYGVGVPPENHPSSWFAMVKGRKRWVLNPPQAGSGRNGGEGSEPAGVMFRHANGEMCVPVNKPLGALHCDQQEGEVIWVPTYWWHETCGLEDFSIGLGALTYDGCCPESQLDRKEECTSERHKGDSYGVHDIPVCVSGERECGGLPFPSHKGLE